MVFAFVFDHTQTIATQLWESKCNKFALFGLHFDELLLSFMYIIARFFYAFNSIHSQMRLLLPNSYCAEIGKKREKKIKNKIKIIIK